MGNELTPKEIDSQRLNLHSIPCRFTNWMMAPCSATKSINGDSPSPYNPAAWITMVGKWRCEAKGPNAWEVPSRIFWPAFVPKPHYTLKRPAFIPNLSTPLEFDEKKFWIALFSTMVRRKTAPANAITESFAPSVSFGGECVQFQTGIKKRGESPKHQQLSLKL
jgi:hypothetical protein